MSKGDHIAVIRSTETRHGIDCGNGLVVEYCRDIDEKPLRMVTVDEFTEGREYYTVRCADYLENELVAWLAADKLLDKDLWAGPEQLAA